MYRCFSDVKTAVSTSGVIGLTMPLDLEISLASFGSVRGKASISTSNDTIFPLLSFQLGYFCQVFDQTVACYIYRSLQETQLSLTNRETHNMCKYNGVAADLLKRTRPSPLCVAVLNLVSLR